MGLYHSVGIAYGFEIPTNTDHDDIDRALFGQPDNADSVGYLVIGDHDRLLLVTRVTTVAENAVVRLTPDALAQPDELAEWESALHDAAVRLGLTDHPAPAWLVIHNYR
jgi:hypothetical protein